MPSENQSESRKGPVMFYLITSALAWSMFSEYEKLIGNPFKYRYDFVIPSPLVTPSAAPPLRSVMTASLVPKCFACTNNKVTTLHIGTFTPEKF
jgi:hypothetical protein